MALFPASTYVLVNEQNKIVGVYDDLRQLAMAVASLNEE